MKAADISDEDFVAAVRLVQDRTGGWANRWQIGAILAGHPELIQQPYTADPDWPTIPQKVLLAKAKRVIGRGLIDGCPCGCRGDFETPDRDSFAQLDG